MRILTKLPLLAVIAVATMASMCSSGELKNNSKLAHRSFAVLRGVRDTNASLHDRGKVTDAEFRTNVVALQSASAAAGEFITAVDTALTEIERLEAVVAADPSEDNKERLKAAQTFAKDNIRPLAKAFGVAVRNLNDQGVLRVKNPEARAQLSDLLSFVLELI